MIISGADVDDSVPAVPMILTIRVVSFFYSITFKRECESASVIIFYTFILTNAFTHILYNFYKNRSDYELYLTLTLSKF